MSTDSHEDPCSTWNISFRARVRADEIRFDDVPDTDVSFSGRPDYESVSTSQRTNIPNKVEKTTYNDVDIDYTLACELKFHDYPDFLPSGQDAGETVR
jgi:hypothetical protein